MACFTEQSDSHEFPESNPGQPLSGHSAGIVSDPGQSGGDGWSPSTASSY